MSEPLIRVDGLAKDYVMGSNVVAALRGVTLDIAAGEFVAVMGPSGSGKSTFMNLLGCLDHPSAGSYWLGGQEVSALSGDELAAVRNRRLGFVFQHFNLLARTTALDNVALPLLYGEVPASERYPRAERRLTQIGLAERMDHHPSQLSGGQQQRVAIARALVHEPRLVVCDEPTAALDHGTGQRVMDLLRGVARQRDRSLLVVTHDARIFPFADRIAHMDDGRVERIVDPPRQGADA